MTTTPAESRLTDEQLAERIAARNERDGELTAAELSFEQLYDRHARRLLVFLSSRVKRDDLEDVHQVVWQRVWEFLPNQFHGGNFRAWLHRIARNYLIDLSRRKRPDLVDEDRLAQPPGPPSDDQLVEAERVEILRSCLQRLEESMARLVYARLRGDSYDDVCAQLEIDPARAHKLFHTAKARLQKCVQRALK